MFPDLSRTVPIGLPIGAMAPKKSANVITKSETTPMCVVGPAGAPPDVSSDNEKLTGEVTTLMADEFIYRMKKSSTNLGWLSQRRAQEHEKQ